MPTKARPPGISTTLRGSWRGPVTVHTEGPHAGYKEQTFLSAPMVLKNGEIWQDIKQELDDLNVKPTGDDAHWMESCIEEAFEQTEQAILN